MARKWRNPARCRQCGNDFLTRRRPNGTATEFCSRACANARLAGANNPRWRGGRAGDIAGYEWVALPVAQRNRSGLMKGKYQREHVWVCEQQLGERLKPGIHGDIVHHINGDRRDNRPGNLIVCSQAMHRAIHGEMARRWQREHFAGRIVGAVLDLRGRHPREAPAIVDQLLHAVGYSAQVP